MAKRTPRAILERINKLEEDGKIGGYTLKTQAKNFENTVIRLILISFKTSPIFNERIAMFTYYLQNAPFAAFAARTRGEYDWVNVKILLVYWRHAGLVISRQMETTTWRI
jgi:DNA-binding Lrp family transcriptional regulator